MYGSISAMLCFKESFESKRVEAACAICISTSTGIISFSVSTYSGITALGLLQEKNAIVSNANKKTETCSRVLICMLLFECKPLSAHGFVKLSFGISQMAAHKSMRHRSIEGGSFKRTPSALVKNI